MGGERGSIARRVAAAIVGLVLVGCGSSNESGPRDTACVPGASVACTCAGGATGAQVCQADGAAFDACVCTPADVSEPAAEIVLDVVDAAADGASPSVEAVSDAIAGADTSPGDTVASDGPSPDPGSPEPTPVEIVEPDDVAFPDLSGGGDLACADGSGQPATFEAMVIDFQTRKPLAGAHVQAYEPTTGQLFGATKQTSAEGLVQVDAASCSGTPSFRVTLDGQRDTFTLYVRLPSAGQGATLWSVSNGTYVAAPALAGISMNEAKGLLIGGVFFTNGQGEDESVGCAKVDVPDALPTAAAFAADNIRYLNDAGLPTTLDHQASINPQVPFFIVGNLPVQTDEAGLTVPWIVTARVGQQVVAHALVPGIAGSAVIADLHTYTEATAPAGVAPVLTNPMPPDCGW